MKAKPFDLDAFAKKHKLTVGARFRSFIVGNESKKYQDSFIMGKGLPYWDKKSKIKLEFFRPTFFSPIQDQGVALAENPGLVPFCGVADAGDFFAAKVADVKCPVLYWDHETGKFTKIADSLDSFLDRLCA
jgi:hypothetical protein